MATTRTQTATKTYSRIDLLTLQVRVALRRAGIEPALVEKIRGAVEKHWIARILIYGKDAQGRASCLLLMEIDWPRHTLHAQAGRTTVEIDHRWTGDTAIELDETLSMFEEFIRVKRLRPVLEVTYAKSSTATYDQIQRALGFVDAEPVVWAGYREEVMMKIPELDELSVGFFMVA
jgi:hypothetical protein